VEVGAAGIEAAAIQRGRGVRGFQNREIRHPETTESAVEPLAGHAYLARAQESPVSAVSEKEGTMKDDLNATAAPAGGNPRRTPSLNAGWRLIPRPDRSRPAWRAPGRPRAASRAAIPPASRPASCQARAERSPASAGRWRRAGRSSRRRGLAVGIAAGAGRRCSPTRAAGRSRRRRLSNLDDQGLGESYLLALESEEASDRVETP
jgi:hypothetical protein